MPDDKGWRVAGRENIKAVKITDWKEEVRQLHFDRGYTWPDTAIAMRPYFPGLTDQQIKEKIRSPFRSVTVRKPKPEPPAKPAKVDVVQNFEPCVKEVNWKGNRITRFGLMGDTQINSKYTQLTYLHDFYDRCAADGIKHVYHTGDIDDGDQMRMGHQYECYNQGADDHEAEIVRVYPRRPGVTTHFITGNHDASITKRSGHDIGKAISGQRDDMEYLGQDCAVIYLTPNCTLQLQHNWDGTAYALSYKPQKMIEAMQADAKPNILAIGHYHKSEYLFYRSVHAFQTGCFQMQTPFERGKQISISMGGWIITVEVDENGFIQRTVPEFIPYYKPIKDDWKNWQSFKP